MYSRFLRFNPSTLRKTAVIRRQVNTGARRKPTSDSISKKLLLIGGMATISALIYTNEPSLAEEMLKEMPQDKEQLKEMFDEIIKDDKNKIAKIIDKYPSIPREFIELYSEHFGWVEWEKIMSKMKVIDNDFLDMYIKKGRKTWTYIIRKRFPDDDFLDRYGDHLDWSEWNIISQKRELTDDFLQKYAEKIRWDYVVEKKRDDLNFLSKYGGHINKYGDFNRLIIWRKVTEYYEGGCRGKFNHNYALRLLYEQCGDHIGFHSTSIRDKENTCTDRYGHEVPIEYKVPHIPGMKYISKKAWEKIKSDPQIIDEIDKMEEFLKENMDRIAKDEHNKKSLLYIIKLIENKNNEFSEYDKYESSHSNITAIEIDPNTYHQGINYFKSGRIKCSESDEEFTATKSVLPFSKWKIHDPRYCNHSHFKVDAKDTVPEDDVIIVNAGKSLGGSLIRMFGGPVFSGVENVYRRHEQARCVRCGVSDISVYCDFKTVTEVDEEYNSTTRIENTSEWKRY